VGGLKDALDKLHAIFDKFKNNPKKSDVSKKDNSNKIEPSPEKPDETDDKPEEDNPEDELEKKDDKKKSKDNKLKSSDEPEDQEPNNKNRKRLSKGV
jgi:hypothetical protein